MTKRMIFTSVTDPRNKKVVNVDSFVRRAEERTAALKKSTVLELLAGSHESARDAYMAIGLACMESIKDPLVSEDNDELAGWAKRAVQFTIMMRNPRIQSLRMRNLGIRSMRMRGLCEHFLGSGGENSHRLYGKCLVVRRSNHAKLRPQWRFMTGGRIHDHGVTWAGLSSTASICTFLCSSPRLSCSQLSRHRR